MENKKKETKKRDKWDKAEIILRPVGGLLAAITVAGVGFFGSNYLDSRQDNELRIRLYTELITNREEADSALRKDMFTSIIGSFLNPKEAKLGLEEKVLQLELLAYNFHESLNLMPLFLHLDKQINLLKIEDIDSSKQSIPIQLNSDKQDYKDRLDKVAREITHKQLAILGRAGETLERSIYLSASFNITEQSIDSLKLEGVSVDVLQEIENFEVFIDKEKVEEEKLEEEKVKLLDSLQVRIGKEPTRKYGASILKHLYYSPGFRNSNYTTSSWLIDESLEIDEIERDFKVRVLEADSTAKELKVRLEIITIKESSDEEYTNEEDVAEFWVGFFDFPMIDNTRLSHDQRCAIVLNKFEYPLAEITLVYFPGSYSSLKEKPYYQEVVEKLVTDRSKDK
ncbi:MAG: hypothetical protein ACE5IR_22050 [bacterium]